MLRQFGHVHRRGKIFKSEGPHIRVGEGVGGVPPHIVWKFFFIFKNPEVTSDTN